MDDEIAELLGDECIDSPVTCASTTTDSTRSNTISDSSSLYHEQCNHSVIETLDSGINVCTECGCNIITIDHDPEWKCYSNSGDNSRCHSKPGVVKGSIKTLFEQAKIPPSVVNDFMISRTEERYRKIVGDATVRGDKRKGIVAACLLQIFNEDGDIRTFDEVRALFKLEKEKMSDGLKKYHATFPESRTKNIQPRDLIVRTMRATGVPSEHYNEILRVAENITNRDYTINHSSPQSVAPAIIYYYLCMKPELKKKLELQKSKFAMKVGLSDITITKIVKKIHEVYTKFYSDASQSVDVN